jgi:hypothetical protein
MLLILIPIVWLAVVSVFVGICQIAARGDGRTQAAAPETPTRVRDGLVVWDPAAAMALRARDAARTPGVRSRRREAHPCADVAQRRRIVAH